MEERKKFRIGDIWRFIWNFLVAIFHGEVLIRLNIKKYFPQIAYTFFLFTLFILFSLMVDNTLTKVERHREIIGELEREYADKTFQLVTLNRRSTVEELLLEKGSEVGEPLRPAKKLK